MKRYEQRPVEVEAVRFDEAANLRRIVRWVRRQGVAVSCEHDSLGRPYVRLGLMEGVVEWRWGQWLVADPLGEFTVYSDATFRRLHHGADHLPDVDPLPVGTDIIVVPPDQRVAT